MSARLESKDSTLVPSQRVARFGVIDRSVERSPCARRSDRPKQPRINRPRCAGPTRTSDDYDQVRLPWPERSSRVALARLSVKGAGGELVQIAELGHFWNVRMCWTPGRSMDIVRLLHG
jgi:hypothetical protein